MSIPPVSAIGRIRPGELTEAASPLSRAPKSEKSRSRGTISPSTVLDTIERHVLLDGFRIVVDLEKSRGSYLYYAVDDRRLIDLYGFFRSMPVGFKCPHIDFSLPASQREADVIEQEKQAEREIYQFIEQRNIDICAIIIEPIQGEGGDNHFRGEWLQKLRRICDESDILLIFDEVQSGIGVTGRNWCCEHFDVLPDLMSFGKKAQVCGVMAGPRIDEVTDNAFRLPSRLNSTWGGNFTDMVRSTHYLRIIEQERLVENAAKVGAYFLEQLRDLQTQEPLISAARGRGLFLAFDLPDAKTREEFWHGFFDLGVLTLRSGEHSIRFRPALDITAQVIDQAMELMRKFCRQRRQSEC